MAWLTGWSYRQKLTLDSSKVDSDCSDFPVKVVFDKDNFAFAHALETGNDIRFTSSDGETLLKYERELHQVGDTPTGYANATYDTSFNGSDEFYSLPSAANLHKPYQVLEVEFTADTVDGWHTIVNLEMADRTNAAYSSLVKVRFARIEIYYGYLRGYFRCRTSGTSAIVTVTSAQTISADTKYKARLVIDNNTKQIWFYINDVYQGTAINPDISVWSDVTNYIWCDLGFAYDYHCTTSTSHSQYFDGTIHSYNLMAQNTLTSAVYHVKLPTASSTSDTEFYCYYGKADATDGADPTNVWDSNYKMVLHMDSALEDSTANDNDGTNSGTALGIARDGYYRSFDGSNDQITFSGLNLNGASQASIELYINTIGQTSDYPTILGDYDDWDNAIGFRGGRTTSSDQRYICYWENNNNANANVWIYDTDADFNTWYHVASHFNAGASKALLDGEVIDTGSDGPATLPTLSGSFVMGGPSGTTLPGYFNGHIAEARISTIARSDAWIKATHASLADTLLTYGAEEALTPTARPRVMVVWA